MGVGGWSVFANNKDWQSQSGRETEKKKREEIQGIIMVDLALGWACERQTG